MLGTPEHQRLFALVAFEVAFQQLCLVTLRDEMHSLGDFLNRFAGGGHLHLDGIAQIGVGQILDQFRHRGRKQQCLTLQRNVFRDFFQGMDEPHVQHLVSLIQHQITAMFQIDRVAFQKVDQPARRGHQHIGALGKPFGLAENALAAGDGMNLASGAFGKNLKVYSDLRNKFARWGQDKRAHVAGAGRVADIQQAVQQGQAKRGGFAGAGLRQTHQIAARHDMRDRLHLNGGWCGDCGFSQCCQYLGRQAKVCESRHHSLSGGQMPPVRGRCCGARQWEAPPPRIRAFARYRRERGTPACGGNQCRGLSHAHAARALR